MMRAKKILWCITASIALAGCTDTTPPASNNAATSAKVFRILAGSELRDIANKVEVFGNTMGTKVEFTFSGSIDAVDKLADKHGYDAVWVSHGKYLQLVPGVKEQVKTSEKTMYSRVVLGVKPTKAKELGWSSGKVTWKQVVAAAQTGKFRFAMTNPAGSNTGFVTLVGVASEMSGKGDALEEADIPEGALQKFFSGMALSSGSSGELAEKFKASSDVDGIVNYESVIATLSQNGLPLQVIVPKEGVITADYPLMLLNNSKNDVFYKDLVKYLRQEDTQEWIASNTYRTPLKGNNSDEFTNELPFPGNIKVVDAVLRGFLNSYSKPSVSYFVMDISGSMAGTRIGDMRASFNSLVTSDGSVAGRFSTFRDRENVVFTPFSDKVFQSRELKLTSSTPHNEVVLQQAKEFINSLEANGGTAIYDALAHVYPSAQDKLKKGDRTVSIVLFTDGANTNGRSIEHFETLVSQLGAPRVPVYTIQYGDARAAEIKAIATVTGGRVFDAKALSLKQTLKTIRSYQ